MSVSRTCMSAWDLAAAPACSFEGQLRFLLPLPPAGWAHKKNRGGGAATAATVGFNLVPSASILLLAVLGWGG